MKNKDFFYLQYNKIDWKNQEKTRINEFINNHVIQNVILKHKGDSVFIFDIGFGIGFFLKMLLAALTERYKSIVIEGCEPSQVSYDYFLNKQPKRIKKSASLKTSKETFQDIKTKTRFDFITAMYVFPHFLFEELDEVVKKIHSMLADGGKFVLVLANGEYLENKLKTEKDLFLETKMIEYNGRRYKEWLHYADIPKIGKIIDYNREEAFYLDLFANNDFTLKHKENIDDSGFICTLFVFERKTSDEWGTLLKHKAHHLQFNGADILVEDGVFTPNPEITRSTSMILENMPKLKWKMVADVGTGTGVLAVLAALKGARVVATNNSNVAVSNALKNAKANKVADKISVVRTNVLDGIDEKFDFIFANLPILNEFWELEQVDVDSVLGTFFKTVKEKMNPGGKIYFPWASFAEDKREWLEKYILAQGYSFDLIKEDKLGYTWYLYVLSIQNI